MSRQRIAPFRASRGAPLLAAPMFAAPLLATPLLAAALLAALLPSSAAHAASDVILHQVLAVSLGGQEVGTIEATDRRTPEGIELLRRSRLTVQRGATSNVVQSTTRVLLKPDLSPVSYRYERTDASGKLVSEGRIVNNTFELVTTQDGARVANSTPVAAGTTFSIALEHAVRTQLGRSTEAPMERPVIIEELGAFVTMKVRTQKAAQGFTVTSSFMQIETVEEVDVAGRTLVARTPAMGIVAYPVGRAPADLRAQAQGTADLIALSTWTTQTVTPPVSRVTYRIRAPDAAAFFVPEDDRQKILRRTARTIEVSVSAGSATRGGLTEAQRRRWTSATPYEAVDDPRIVKAAAEAARGAVDRRDEVRRLVQFVYRHVQTKGLDRGYAPAVATLESRAGDCTEHSVLLSALLRARGFPTRLVDGVVVDGTRAGYHEWVEVHLDGEGFVPADPTFGAFPAGPERLKLAEGSTLPDEHLQLSLAAARLLKPGVKIEVVESAKAESAQVERAR